MSVRERVRGGVEGDRVGVFMMSICYLIRSKVCRVVFSSQAQRAFRLRQHFLTLDDIARSLACKESGISELHIRLVKFGGKKTDWNPSTAPLAPSEASADWAMRPAARYCIIIAFCTALQLPLAGPAPSGSFSPGSCGVMDIESRWPDVKSHWSSAREPLRSRGVVEVEMGFKAVATRGYRGCLRLSGGKVKYKDLKAVKIRRAKESLRLGEKPAYKQKSCRPLPWAPEKEA